MRITTTLARVKMIWTWISTRSSTKSVISASINSWPCSYSHSWPRSPQQLPIRSYSQQLNLTFGKISEFLFYSLIIINRISLIEGVRYPSWRTTRTRSTASISRVSWTSTYRARSRAATNTTRARLYHTTSRTTRAQWARVASMSTRSSTTQTPSSQV